MSTMPFTGTLGLEVCCRCGIAFGMPLEYQNRRRTDHEAFYCPAGHRQYYLQKTKEEKLQEQLERMETSRDFHITRARSLETQVEHAEHRVRGQKAAKTRIKNRIAKGVCPCCNRQFANLHAHMNTKHPDWVEGE